MSIATALTKLETDITSAYNAVQTKGGTIPTNKNTNNLSTAINSISGGATEIEYFGNSSTFLNVTITPTLQKLTYKETHPSRLSLVFNYANIADDIYATFRTMPQTYTIYMQSQAFRQCTAKRIGLGVSLKPATTMALMFYGCSNLEEIYGEPFDTSGITSASNMPSFNMCQNLKKITFKENTINFNINFDSSPLLEDDTIISIANGLNESATSQTLSLHNTSKAKCSTIMGTVDSTTYSYKVFIPSDSGTMSLEEFITIEKGWTLS